MKVQLNQSKSPFTYDGDYSFLHKAESVSAPKSSASNSLMWLKIAGHKKKNVAPAKSIAHHDLMWLKLDGYNQSKSNNSKMEAMQSKMYSSERFHESIYERIKLQKARHQFYFSAMTMLILLNLVFFLSIFNH